MTDYKAIFGKKIKFLTTDLSAAEAEGEIFYSDSAEEFKVAVAAGAWSAGSSLSAARKGLAGAGTQTLGLVFGGTGDTNATEEYNGSGWAAGGDLNTARASIAGAGTQTAGLAIAGNAPPVTNSSEEYDGTSWTASNNLGTARSYLAGMGTQTAGLAFGGDAAQGNTGKQEEYNSTEDKFFLELNLDIII